MLTIKNYHVQVEDKDILHDINLQINKGEVHVIMGPNGSGKSTLANSLAGHPTYTVTKGSVLIDNNDITSASPDEKAKAGLFLSMQYLPEISGVTIGNFLRIAYNSLHNETVHPLKFFKVLQEKAHALGIEEAFLKRSLGVGFSGGEKKRLELLQLSVLNPTYAILDETDSGLDIDALDIVMKGITSFANEDKGVLLITHYPKVIELIKPDVVHIMKEGKIVESGNADIAERIAKEGFNEK